MCPGFDILCFWDPCLSSKVNEILIFGACNNENILTFLASVPLSPQHTLKIQRGKTTTHIVKWLWYSVIFVVCTSQYLVYKRFWTAIVNSTSNHHHQNKKRSSLFWNTGVHPCSVCLCQCFFPYYTVGRKWQRWLQPHKIKQAITLVTSVIKRTI